MIHFDGREVEEYAIGKGKIGNSFFQKVVRDRFLVYCIFHESRIYELNLLPHLVKSLN